MASDSSFHHHPNLRRALAVVLLGSAALHFSAPCGALFAGMEMHHDWASVIVEDEGRVRFRSLTQNSAGTDYVALVLDRLPGECTQQYMTLNVVLGLPEAKTKITADTLGWLRVDRKPPRQITYAMEYEKGDEIARAVVKSFGKDGPLLEELEKGKEIRLKMATGKGPLNLRFSLAGLGAAMQRTLALCRAAADPNDHQPQPAAPPIPPAPSAP